uniref:Thiamine biosynthesis protein n=1 Tax=Protohalopteris sp. TaxID=2843287 RepID=A0A8F0F898_9PHAE|nr:thiamine biosynthesis protein [Protohalopteris sp.]
MNFKSFFLIVSVNGQKYKIFIIKPTTVLSIIKFFNYEKELNLIEHNGKIQSDLTTNSSYLKDTSKIEIITIVGGG